MPDRKPYKAAGKLEGKAALISGADSGIGRATALLLALEGADVTIVFMPEEKVDAEESLRDFSEKSKGRSKVVLAAFDLRDELNCGTLVEMHLNERVFSSVDFLEDLPTEQWRDTFHTNIHPFFHVVRATSQHMTQGGSIVFDAGVNPSKEAR